MKSDPIKPGDRPREPFAIDPGAILDSLCGMCPVQGEGVVDGKPWYFRARYDSWAFAVAGDEGDAIDAHIRAVPGAYFVEENWGAEFEAGYMPLDVAEGFIRHHIEAYRKWRTAPAIAQARALLAPESEASNG